ncbi:MAG: hypothetical protein R3F17_15960 [Planctomycetota bacterium]
MTQILRLVTIPSLVVLAACQSENTPATGETKSVATMPASSTHSSSDEIRITVPRLADAGVADGLRQALMALPAVTQVLPNLSASEVIVRTRSAVSNAEIQQVLQTLGIQGTVR